MKARPGAARVPSQILVNQLLSIRYGPGAALLDPSIKRINVIFPKRKVDNLGGKNQKLKRKHIEMIDTPVR